MVTDGEFLDARREVRVTMVEGDRVVVEGLDGIPGSSPSAWLAGEDKAKSAEQRKHDHQPFEDRLVDFAKQPAPEQNAANHCRCQPGFILRDWQS